MALSRMFRGPSKLSIMKIFVSWSGHQALLVAEALKTWLPSILMKKVELFVSSQDIAKGERGLSVIADELEGHNFGLVVVSRANLNSPWVNFETGALTKSLGKSYVSPLLLDITDADVVGPLGQFQATALTDKEDVWKLIKGINRVVNEGLPDEDIRVLFDSRWSDFEQVVTGALAGAVPETTRTDKDLLEEVLGVVRGIARDMSRGYSAALPNYESGAPLTEWARREALNRRTQKLFPSEHREEPVDSEYERHTRDEALAEHMAELEADDQARAEAMAERFAEDQARAEAEAEARAENGKY
jgi:hypothetical protein